MRLRIPHISFQTSAEQNLAVGVAEAGQRLDTGREPHADRVDRLLVGQVTGAVVGHDLEVRHRLLKHLLRLAVPREGHRLGQSPVAEGRAKRALRHQVDRHPHCSGHLALESAQLHQAQWPARQEQQVDVRPLVVIPASHGTEHPYLLAAGVVNQTQDHWSCGP